ncbi:alpha/beta fold hydrolase [Roseibium sp. RKSG952]|uniref:alpha/beta fold hydrolase n=1 Tax=Roseibium sp. RKSG952 TaxID=2529384 RepID=UPI0012BCC0A1|nr:alpha/beta hydrolase [Roseibium sp. RKSG952]MTH97238.1 alpha/beta hydrolase [Roseibium sp. RKSG952]
MTHLRELILSSAIALSASAALPASAHADAKNVVLVHGLNMDGGAWRGVHERLTADGYSVTVVQMPLTSASDDIAAARRAIEAQDGPVVLVGHSYGGMVISETGTGPNVAALVYVASFLPEKGESLGALNASIPTDFDPSAIKVSADGFYVLERDAWIKSVANDIPEADANYTADFQTAAHTSIFGYQAEVSAWKDKPSWAVIPTRDLTVAPQLQHKMAARAGASVTEIEAGHLVNMSHPDAITDIIKQAAETVD